MPLFGAAGFDASLMREAVPFEEQLLALQELVEAGKVHHSCRPLSPRPFCWSLELYLLIFMAPQDVFLVEMRHNNQGRFLYTPWVAPALLLLLMMPYPVCSTAFAGAPHRCIQRDILGRLSVQQPGKEQRPSQDHLYPGMVS